MHGPGTLTLGVALVLVFAGCVEADKPAARLETSVAPAPTHSADTGAIQGTVTDDQLAPLARVGVAIEGPTSRTAETDAAGAFTFNDLEPGAYVVHASRVGYESRSSRVQVEPDNATKVQVVLEAIVIVEPRHESFIDDGFIHLVFAFGSGYVNPGSPLGTNKISFAHDAQEGAVEAVATNVWQPSSATSATWLSLYITRDSDHRNSTVGKSPLTVRLPELEITKKTPLSFGSFVSSPCVLGTNAVDTCAGDPPTRIVQVVYEQRYKLHSTVFYVEAAPTGYTAAPA